MSLLDNYGIVFVAWQRLKGPCFATSWCV